MSGYELLNESDIEPIQFALVRLGVCQSGQRVESVSKAGDGNMNLVLRVRLDSGSSVIVKQSRPWVQKYPSIAAPDQRILAETAFYETIASVDGVAKRMPVVIASDPSSRTLILEDLGQASECTDLYHNVAAMDEAFGSAVDWLARLHSIPVNSDSIGCQPLLRLNHDHIFVIPLADPPALDLDTVCEGLTKASDDLRRSGDLQREMLRLGRRYLAGGNMLSHGDYYPGSWLHAEDGIRIIDPEFCFLGPREFDLGVLIAHRILCHGSAKLDDVQPILVRYGHDSIDRTLLLKFAGCEIIRRLLGVAQLPINANLDQRLRWLQVARELVLA